MKFVANLTLIILVIPLFLTGLILGTVRFQLLEPSFWQSTFRENNVYSNLAKSLKDTAEKQTVSEGGSLQEARVLTNLITPGNLQDFIERNTKNILDFANGKAKEAMVYIPLSVVPKGLLPANLGKIKENTPLSTILSEFHFQGVQKEQIENFSKIGQTVSYLLVLDAAVLVLILIGFFLLTDKGKRFSASAAAFVITGIVSLALSLFGFVIRSSMFTDWVKSGEPSQAILAPFAPYVLGEIIKVWTIAGIFAIFIGIVLLFFRKNRFYD